ncbi:DUF3617 family protein [Pontixanthobacter sp. CEM42]|uniref:DUF3617 domain-containing protein n=1 Tax=Pontixanthobacter sp. CEM42 TaxID=2792077 RepID=UPI001ADF6FFD|nr:DUF3617 family protein [Pontixanthobacter sp. CEM42]
MHITKLVATGTLALLFASCGSNPDAGEMRAGKWQVYVGITEFDVPGATDEQKKVLEGTKGEVLSGEQCYSEEQAKAGVATLTKEFEQGNECKMGDFANAGEQVTGTLTCTMDGGIETDLAITGSIASDKFRLEMDTEFIQDDLPNGKANMSMEVVGERLGDC